MNTWELEYNQRFINRLRLELPSGSRILDAACGKGGLYNELSVNNTKYTGIDIETFANWRKLSNCGAILVKGSIVNLPFKDNVFDCIFLKEALHHIDKRDHAKTLSEILRVLDKGGDLIVAESNRYNPISLIHMVLFRRHKHLTKGYLYQLINKYNHPVEFDSLELHNWPIRVKKLRYLFYRLEGFLEKLSIFRSLLSLNIAIIYKL